ncbi:pneumococcal serine-rich repeat protein [Drosophila subpulchrella]|uniref:pneumococcal serine-rich repeat protein n=1 Tax=Drosophila subpulchrella TaxID=1486046 RepID=UPI0018A182EC|nr:pneumococcal serine-rich repeat protein [Drosophila subpulchrella]XP_037707850.1 pneumococcal serine-rich repeat protein [Drosophila subpulchrella]XP_037707851.1 pneumococcal serine-rich repeat protein [Drosophila subpulchrella]XP_037707852.1 pneumococcal serine-rich repeat protein [Drosophila subpulchrella]
MAKLSRRASSSAATPARATTATTASTGATSVNPSHATGVTQQQEEQHQQQEQHQRQEQHQAQGESQQHTKQQQALQQLQHQQQQRIARRATSNSNINSSNSRPQAAALIDTSPDVLHENPPPSPTPAALSNHSSSNNSYHSNTATPTAPAHSHVTATPYMPLLPPGERNLTEAENAAERARIREEFFATYDVMTGVRIAATLGGFFGLMVFLIVWKSRSSSNETLKVLKDPKMAAVAAVCMQEEEEREIHDAIVATGMSIYPDEYDAMVYRRQRMLSLGNVSAPPLLNRGYRCGSMGGVGVGVPVGYSYLLEPPRRFSYSSMSGGGGPGSGHVGRRKSGSESSRIFSNYPMGGSFGTDDYFVETEDELEAEEYMQPGATDGRDDHQHQRTDSTRSKPGFLSVPMAGQDSRRSSAMTCCSTDSSYLERRTSAYMAGCMGNLPTTLQRKLSTASRTSSIENWDYYYPDIQVIQPTPKASPCPSERSVHEGSGSGSASGNGSRTSNLSAPNIKRKHSIVSYDPDSAQAGRKQQIHSISADTVDVYPYNQESTVDLALALPLPKPVQSAPPTSAHQAFHFCDSPSEELRLGVRRKLTLVELQRNESNNNSFPYTANAAAPVGVAGTAASSSSISVDSTPVSLERLNGAGSAGSASLATISVSNKIPAALMGNSNPEKRAPLASLSSFKISSLECPDSELRSLDEDSVFGLESPADTDDDMQQLSSDSEEQEAAAQAQAQAQAASMRAGGETKPNPLLLGMPVKRMSLSAVPSGGLTGAALTGGGGGGGARPRRPLLQRHRTISVTSSDRVALINQPLQLQQFHMGLPIQSEAPPLETHFGAVVSQSPPRRGPLLQQYSDPQTTTTTTTTTTTEEDTCSTLNTELGLVEASGAALGGGGGGGESATHTQYSSLNTVISMGRSTPSPIPISVPVLTTRMDNNATASQATQQPAQLPTNAIRLVHDPCPLSVSDSMIATRQQSICMPASLKDLILRKGSAPASASTSGISRSAANLSCESGATAATTTTATAAVMLELPLIRLPNEEDDEHQLEHHAHLERDSGEKRDPSLPGTSRKWSKETLF